MVRGTENFIPAVKSHTAHQVQAVSEISNPTPMGTMKAVSASSRNTVRVDN